MSGLSAEYILKHDSKPAHCFSAHVQGKGYVNRGNNPETLEDYNAQLARTRLSHIENLQWANGYAEPGYTAPAKGILFCDWNPFSREVSDLLERAGYAIEWEDEWTTCEDCGKAVRTFADGYDWTHYYVLIDECSIVCLDCVDWPQYLRSIEDTADVACMPYCNPAEHGYVLISGKYETGFHPGQNDSPNKLLAELQAQGKEHIIFRISETSQFYSTWEVWTRSADDEQEEN